MSFRPSRNATISFSVGTPSLVSAKLSFPKMMSTNVGWFHLTIGKVEELGSCGEHLRGQLLRLGRTAASKESRRWHAGSLLAGTLREGRRWGLIVYREVFHGCELLRLAYVFQSICKVSGRTFKVVEWEVGCDDATVQLPWA